MNKGIIKQCWALDLSFPLSLVSVFLISRGTGAILTHPRILPCWESLAEVTFWWASALPENGSVCVNVSKTFTMLVYFLSFIGFFSFYHLAVIRKTWRIELFILGIVFTSYGTWCFAYYSERKFQKTFMEVFSEEQEIEVIDN